MSRGSFVRFRAAARPYAPLALLAPFAVLALLHLACARKSPEGAADNDSPRASRVPILVVAVADEPDQLVPPLSRSPASAALWPWIFPALVRIEGDTLGRGRIEPDLAVSWQAEDGGRALRFFLDSARLWEDTTVVGASDVVESYRLYRDPAIGGDWAGRLDEIASVESPADGRGSVLFRFRKSMSRTRALQLASLPLISSAQWAQAKDRKPALGEPDRLVHSAGPFRIDEWKRGDYIRLARNPFAPQGRTPRTEQLLLRFVPSGRSRAAQVQAGVADLAVDLPVEDVILLRAESPGIRLVRAGACAADAIVWNLDHPLWGGLALRRALCGALDLAAIRSAAGGGEEAGDGEPATGEACYGLLRSVGGAERSATARTDVPVGISKPPPVAPDSGGSRRPSAPGDSAVSTPGAAGDSAITRPSAPGDSAASTPGAAGDSAITRSATPGDSVISPPATSGPSLESAPAGADGASTNEGGTANAISYFGSPPLELLYSTADLRRERAAVEIALQLDRLGVACRLLPLPEEECTSRIAARRFEAALMEWRLPMLQDVGEVYESRGALNPAGFTDASTDSLIARARSAAADTIPDAWERVEKRATAMLPYLFSTAGSDSTDSASNSRDTGPIRLPLTATS